MGGGLSLHLLLSSWERKFGEEMSPFFLSSLTATARKVWDSEGKPRISTTVPRTLFQFHLTRPTIILFTFNLYSFTFHHFLQPVTRPPPTLGELVRVPTRPRALRGNGEAERFPLIHVKHFRNNPTKDSLFDNCFYRNRERGGAPFPVPILKTTPTHSSRRGLIDACQKKNNCEQLIPRRGIPRRVFTNALFLVRSGVMLHIFMK